VSVSYGREAQSETFYTSNIVPQEPELNRGIWEALERIEANDYAGRYAGAVCLMARFTMSVHRGSRQK
jgi:DNA/RNA endonuclease G (NUC1)